MKAASRPAILAGFLGWTLDAFDFLSSSPRHPGGAVRRSEAAHRQHLDRHVGLAYQFGILIAAPTNTIEHMLRDSVGYSWALAGFEIVVIAVLTIVLLAGREERGRSFYSGDLLIEKE